ncbi:MAG TPA: TlyA family RNA methyltransferase [Candidatus Udaeobacter sp.]|jgi:23S rRNA (cytidine1920-2'-O)/16S rRNA (cytidine1409-2'-O)-methyltransferase|nr:TlyA family RNA methyltransferase [Candidatus Udaeobacter sp.]
MGKRERLDKLLLKRGLVQGREEASGKILAGDVLVNERPVTKAGTWVDENATIRLRTKISPYASRGGTKLETALREFDIDVNGKTVLDVGASTGGFTDCLLAHGAVKVYAVDVGYGQLDWKLRNDPRVVVYEKTNIRYFAPGDLPAPADLATVDVSFISLKLVLPSVKTLLVSAGEVVALIKPQFEVGKGKVGKGGVVRSADEHRRVVEEIKTESAALDFLIQGVVESPLLGPKGNKEFFIHLTLAN